jgi:hypothetical protein
MSISVVLAGNGWVPGPTDKKFLHFFANGTRLAHVVLLAIHRHTPLHRNLVARVRSLRVGLFNPDRKKSGLNPGRFGKIKS